MTDGQGGDLLSRADTAMRSAIREASYGQRGLLFSFRIVLRKTRLTALRLRAQPWRFAEFGARSFIGRGFRVAGSDRISIGSGVYLGRDSHLAVTVRQRDVRPASILQIADGAVFGDRLFISCAGSIRIGSSVLASHDVFITDTYHNYRDPRLPIMRQGLVEPSPVVIEDGSFLGRGCSILHGVTVGSGAYVAAGAVVINDVPPRSVVVGNPARIVSQWDEASGRWVAQQ